MDPLTHTLVGVSLAESGLKRWAPVAATTLVIGANLPDVDGIANFLGRDTALLLRRGWTHGVLAMAVLPAMLAWVMTAWARRRGAAGRGVASRLVILSYASVLSHPLLDWLNNYGIRLLMPFDGRWFYGDAVFIIDPWLWLLLGTSGVLAHARRGPGIAGWTILGAAATWLVVTVDMVPVPARVAWVAGIAAIVAVRLTVDGTRATRIVARTCLAMSALYVLAMVAGTTIGERQVAAWTETRSLDATRVMVTPVPADPLRRQVVVATADAYHFLEIDWRRRPSLRPTAEPLQRRPLTPVTRAAAAAPAVRGLMNWIRFPSYEVSRAANGYRVSIRDVRYGEPIATGLGTAVVTLGPDLRPAPSH